MLLGLGTTAALSGGILGTGALTSIEAERTIDIDTAGDRSAFLGLYDTDNGSFVDENNSTLRLRLNDDVGNDQGLGVNHGSGNGDVATTTLVPAFTIKNQGANTMYVFVDHDGATNSGNDVQFVGDDRGVDDDPTDGDDDQSTDVIGGSNLAFIDREGTTENAVTTDLHSGGGDSLPNIHDGGYVEIQTGEAIDVAIQVASDSTSTGNIIETATIQAYDSEETAAFDSISPVSRAT